MPPTSLCLFSSCRGVRIGSAHGVAGVRTVKVEARKSGFGRLAEVIRPLPQETIPRAEQPGGWRGAILRRPGKKSGELTSADFADRAPPKGKIAPSTHQAGLLLLPASSRLVLRLPSPFFGPPVIEASLRRSLDRLPTELPCRMESAAANRAPADVKSGCK